jgi:hypothetical protein
MTLGYRAFKDGLEREGERRIAEKMIRDGRLEEYKFLRSIRDSTERMLNELSYEEQMAVGFVPVVITRLAWKFATLVADEGAELKLSFTKTFARDVRTLRREYERSISLDLNDFHIRNIISATDQFFEGCRDHFADLFFAIDKEVLKRVSEDEFDEIYVNAYMSLFSIDVLQWHNAAMDKMLLERIGESRPTRLHPKIQLLKKALCQFLNPVPIEITKEVLDGLYTFRENIRLIKFQ